MKKYNKFVVFWVLNVILLIGASSFLPNNYVLGNNMFSPLQAALFVGFVWNFVIWNLEKTLKEYELVLKGQTNMMFGYLSANFVTLWIIARFAFVAGFGVSSYVFVLLLALVANFAQYRAWTFLKKK